MIFLDEVYKFVIKNYVFMNVLKGKNICIDDDCLYWYIGMFYKDNKFEV